MRSTLEKTTSLVEAAAFPSRRSSWWKFAPYALSLFFALWALRGISTGNIVDTDAARHAMNGAFLTDWIRSGNLMHPLTYAKQYYGRLPALSMPFHPPLFPFIESLFFLCFGVNFITARVVIALAAGLSVLLLYRLVVSTHGSHALALFVSLTFCSWHFAQTLSTDVMLEFPAMVFVLAALLQLRDFENGYRWRRAVAFAFFAGAAVWTKQHAVFLGGVPFLLILFLGKWKLLRQPALWVSSVVFGAEVVALFAMSFLFKTTGGAAQVIAQPQDVGLLLFWNTVFYIKQFRALLGLIPALFLLYALAAGVPAIRKSPRERGLALHLAWFFSPFPILALISVFDVRYLFLLFPAVIVIVYTALVRIFSRFAGARRAYYAPAAATAVCVAMGFSNPIVFLRGPAEAASAVFTDHPRRIVYCGDADGNFMFEVRSLDPRLQTIVITGDKLAPETFQRGAFETFAQRYGIDHVVIEKSDRPRPWDQLRLTPAASMVLDRNVPMSSSLPRWRDQSLAVYRFTNPSARPEDTITISVPKLGQDVRVVF